MKAKVSVRMSCEEPAMFFSNLAYIPQEADWSKVGNLGLNSFS